jgi:hypothetical protein
MIHFPRKRQIKDGAFDKVEHVHPLIRCDKCKGYYRQGKALSHVCPSQEQRRAMSQEMRRDV